MKTLDALLVLPPMYQSGRTPDYNLKEPLGLMYIDAVLKKNGYHSEILDADLLSLTIDQTVEEIIKKSARVVGFSVMQRAMPSVKLIVEKLRSKGMSAYICGGGFAATLNAEIMLENIPGLDLVFLGEGEYTFSEFIGLIRMRKDWRHIDGIVFRQDGSIVTNRKMNKINLDFLPRPTRAILPVCLEKTNYANILASRGCYGSCSFCSNQAFERMSATAGWRGRNPRDVVDEIEDLRKVYGVNVFKFNDPNLFGPGQKGRQHVIDICKEIISRNMQNICLMGFCRSNDISTEIAILMRAAGFERVLIGMESFNLETLRRLKKGGTPGTINKSIEIFRNAGIDIVPGFMIFNPFTTIETIKTDISFLDQHKFSPILSKPLKIFNGTKLQEIMESEKRLFWTNPFEGYHEYIVDPVVASIYVALKTISTEWIDFLHKNYQEDIWAIKKSTAFRNRLNFDVLNGMVFALEREMLIALISWFEKGFSYRDIFDKIGLLKNRLVKIEHHILSVVEKKEILKTSQFSVNGLALKVHDIILSRKFNTFPEKYRWNND